MRGAVALLALAAGLPASPPSHAAEPGNRCEPAELAALAGWSGVWIAENLRADANGREAPGAPPFIVGMKLAGLEAPWTEEGWERMGAALRLSSVSSSLHSGWGFPVMMSAPAPFTVFVSPEATVILSQYSEVRQIFTDGRPHPPEDDLWPTIWGDSIGCWEGDTLVVDTVAVKYTPGFSFAAPPLSDKARFIERIRLTGPDRLESEITVTDPEFLERPWEVHMTYLRHPVLSRLVLEGPTSENNRVVVQGSGTTIAPARMLSLDSAPPLPSVRLDVAEMDRVVGQYGLEGGSIVLNVERRGERLFFHIPPVLNTFRPLVPEAPLRFMGLDGGRFHFRADASGGVTGVEYMSPIGETITGRRRMP